MDVKRRGGSLNGQPTATATTDVDGFAESPRWRLGTVPGTERVTASVTGLPAVSFTATSRAGRPSIVAAASTPAGGPGQLADPAPAVLVTDQYGNPVRNRGVFFTVIAGNGSTTGNLLFPDANGIVVGDWRLGDPGVNTLTGTLGAQGIADPNVTGNPVTFTVNVAATGTLRVNVTVYGSARSGVAVAISGQASANGVTDANGVALFPRLAPGTYTVTITPPSGTFFNPTTQQTVVAVGATTDVVFDGFGAAPRQSSFDFIIRSMFSDVRHASARIVHVGFLSDCVTNGPPSATNRFFTSCAWHQPFSTDLAGLLPMRVVPSSWMISPP